MNSNINYESFRLCSLGISTRCAVAGVTFLSVLFVGLPVAEATGLVIDTDSLVISASGVLDLKQGNLIVRGVGASPSNYATIAGYVITGFNGFVWDGFGINSSFAATDAEFLTGVGVLDNSQFFKTDFQGKTGLIGDETLAKWTYYGDADLSGIVDDDDQVLLDFGRTENINEWWSGDFNYSGLVDDDDQVLLDGSRANPFYGPLVSQGAAGATAVPEPGVFGLISLAAMALFARRQKRGGGNQVRL